MGLCPCGWAHGQWASAQRGRFTVDYVRQMQNEACGRTPSCVAISRATGFANDSAIGSATRTITRNGTGAISRRRSEVGRGAIGGWGSGCGASPTHGQTGPSQQGQEVATSQPAAFSIETHGAAKPKGEASAKVSASRTEMTDRNVMCRLKISAWKARGAGQSERESIFAF